MRNPALRSRARRAASSDRGRRAPQKLRALELGPRARHGPLAEELEGEPEAVLLRILVQGERIRK